MLDWLRRKLLEGAPPRCPNPGCKSSDWIPTHVVTRVVPGRPWKQRRVGSRGICNDCGTVYSVTIDGVRQHFSGDSMRRVAEDTRDPNAVLGALMGDESVPTYRGV